MSIRKCLRDYNEQNDVTIVLTSHYMKDIETLCDRVIVINHGKLIHDGPLSDIVERFADHKLLTLQFANGEVPEQFDGPGDLEIPRDWLVKRDPPKVTLRIPRDEIARQTARLLDSYEINDISVEDPPIEDTISRMFNQASQPEEHNDPEIDQLDG
jgi:ABC-2 type transport system ATP-binding protein